MEDRPGGRNHCSLFLIKPFLVLTLTLGYFAVLDYPSSDTHLSTAKQNLSRVMEAKAPAEQLRL